MSSKTCKIKVSDTFALIDEDDYELLINFNWWLIDGYARTELTKRQDKDRMAVSMHEVIMRTPADKITDHINRNKLDNRKENLRCVTSSINIHNSKGNKNNTSGARNVYWAKRRGKWMAQIWMNWKPVYLGYYTDIEEAKRVVEEFRDANGLR